MRHLVVGPGERAAQVPVPELTENGLGAQHDEVGFKQIVYWSLRTRCGKVKLYYNNCMFCSPLKINR